MGDELYYKLLEVLTLGHLLKLDSLDKMEKAEDFALFYNLNNKYSIEDYKDVVSEFIYWYKRNCESKE